MKTPAEVNLLSMDKRVPEFIVKLYSMLEVLLGSTQKKEYSKIICWSDDNLEIQIKNCTRLQDVVLPIYFRHGKTESFIRQLNMYGFSKRNRINHRNSIFFKNEYFQRGDLQSMSKIKRKKKGEIEKLEANSQDIQAESGEEMKGSLTELADEIFKLKQRHPDLVQQMKKIMELTHKVTGCSESITVSTVPAVEYFTNKDLLMSHPNMFQTIKDVSAFQNLESICSFGEKADDHI